MNLKTSMVLTILALLCFSELAIAQGNMVLNGSFDTDTSGWILTNLNVSAGGGYKSAYGDPLGSVLLYNPSSSLVPMASQVIYSLTPGSIYIVSGDYQKSVGKDAIDNSFGAAIDGNFLFETPAPADHSWHSFSFEYTATSTSVLLSLEAQINGTDYSYFIDNISMEAVPEPGSLCLFGLGGMISAMFFKNRRQG